MDVLRRCRFAVDDELKHSKWEKCKKFYATGIQSVRQMWKKRVHMEEDFVENSLKYLMNATIRFGNVITFVIIFSEKNRRP